jgi:CDP-glycerol glycerophosphotransferase (TagB/SpsB family)
MDSMFDYFINNPKYIFIFRPHPYAFPNFIEKGLISKEQFELIKKRFLQSSNSLFDSSRLYLDTLFDADIMITDISSIIAEFFYTGKPIVFCHNTPPETISSEMKLILSCDYNAYSFKDIVLEVEKLSKNLDEYKIKRKQISSNFFVNSKGSTKRINDIIENDYRKKAK